MDQDGSPGPEQLHRRSRRRLYIVLAVCLALATGFGAGAVITRSDPETTPAGQIAQERSAQPSASGTAVGPTASGAGRLGGAPSQSPSPRQSRTTQRSSSGGWPGPANTGVPAGTILKPSGSVNVTRAGTVLDGLDVTGCIDVRANNVTIKRTRVRGSCASGTISTGDFNKYTNILIEDVEVDGLRKSTSFALVAFSGFTCRRCDVHDGGHGIQLGRNVVVEDSWVHDAFTGEGSHNSAIGAFSSSDMVFRHNRLECLSAEHCTAALALLEDGGGPIHNVLAERNLFAGGGYCVYAGVYGSGSKNIKFRNNVFSRTPKQKCGEYGPVTAYKSGSGNEWTGNHFNDASRTAVPPG